VVCVQNRYGIDLRRPAADDMLRICGEQDIAFVPFFAIAGKGGERGPAGDEADVVDAVARAAA
jgi:hypothetical protein